MKFISQDPRNDIILKISILTILFSILFSTIELLAEDNNATTNKRDDINFFHNKCFLYCTCFLTQILRDTWTWG